MNTTSIKGPIAWFASNPVAANLLMVIILIAGVFSATTLRKESFPQLEPKKITISVFYEGGSAQEAEQNIAIKIEDALQTVSGIKKVTSTSTATGSTVTVEREPDVDLNQLISKVKAEVDAITSLPERAERPVIRAQQWDEHALWVQVYGQADRASLQYVADNLRQSLLANNAISKVLFAGRQSPEISIEIDEVQLQAYGLTLSDVSNIVSQESFTEVGGSLRSEDTIIKLKADQQRYRFQDFADIVLLTRSDGSQVRLGEVATIVDGFDQSSRTWMRYQGQRAIGLQIVMGKKDDVVKVVEQANHIVDQWRANSELPANLAIDTWHDRSQSILKRLESVFSNGLSGILLVFCVLTLFLNLRVAFWVAIGLPICFCGALIAMGGSVLDISLNELTTFGFIMAMGIIVDDAIVIGENVYIHRINSSDPIETTIRAVREVSTPTVFGALTTVAAFGSLALVEGEFGEIFAQFGIIVAVCLIFSIIESKFILPSHLAHLKIDEPPPSARHPLQWLRKRIDDGFQSFKMSTFQPLLRIALLYRYATLFLFLALWIFVGGLVLNGTVRSVFFPSIPTDMATVTFSIQQDGSYGLTEKILKRLETDLMSINGEVMREYDLSAPIVISLQTHMIGDLSGQVVAEFSARDARPLSTNEVIERWRNLTGSPEGIQDLKFASEEGAPEGLRIELGSNEPEVLAEAGGRFLEVLESTAGVFNISHNMSPGGPQIRLTLTPEGRALGISAQGLAEQVQQAFFGFETQRIQRDKDEVRVRVRYPEKARQNLNDLWKMRVRTPQGAVVPLARVATAKTEHPATEATRISGRRVASYGANVNKALTSPAAVLQAYESGIFKELKNSYPDLKINLEGEAEESSTVMASLLIAAGFALLMIYTLIAVPLKSYLQPIVIMMAIPFGLIGAILGHVVHGLPISLLSMFGIIALAGVAVNNSMLLVSRFNQVKNQSQDVTEVLINVCSDRLRAIFLTSLTTFVGLIPLMLETSEQGQYLKPAAASLAYGVLFGSLITLFLIPVLIRIGVDIKVTYRKNILREFPVVES